MYESLFNQEQAIELKQQVNERFPDVRCVITPSGIENPDGVYIVGLWINNNCIVTFRNVLQFEQFLNLVHIIAGHLATEDERRREDAREEAYAHRLTQADIDYRRAVLGEDDRPFAMPISDDLQEAQWEHDVN